MAIYIIVIIAMVLLRSAFKSNRKIFCIFAGILLYFLVALRSIQLGLSDTSGIYLSNFNMVSGMTWQSILNYKLPGQIVFLLVTKLIRLFTGNYHVYLAIIGIPYIFMTIRLVYRYSKNPLLSIIYFVALYYLYSFFLLRQVIAIAVVLVAYEYLCQDKIAKYIVFVLIATLIHGSAIVFLLALPFCKVKKFDYTNYLLIAIVYLVSVFAPNVVLKLIGGYSSQMMSWIVNGVYDTKSSISMFGLIITVLTLIVSHMLKNESSYETDMLYNISTLGSMFFAMSNVVTELYRVSLYFSIFNILLISNSIQNIKSRRTRQIVYYSILLVLVFYFFIRSINNVNANPYIFFWNDDF